VDDGRDVAEAVVGGEGWATTLEVEVEPDLIGRKVVSDEAGAVELSPLPVGEAEEFRFPYWQRYNQPVGKGADDAQQATLSRSIRQQASLTMTHVTGPTDR